MLGCPDWELSPCLLRFDLIFLMLDPQDEAYDRRLAHHLVSLYYQSEEQAQEEGMDMAVLRDYIAYAHSTVMPRLSQDTSQALIEVPFGPKCCWALLSSEMVFSQEQYCLLQLFSFLCCKIDFSKCGRGKRIHFYKLCALFIFKFL